MVILGGTAEGRRLAAALEGRAVLSLAGRTADPLTVGATRRGGFGGVAGMVAHLREHAVEAVLDATHPFAADISRNAVAACAEAGVPLLRVVRPGWAGHPLAATWRWVGSHAEAAAVAAGDGRTVLLTVGRQHTVDYVDALRERRVVARVADGTGLTVPAGWELLTSRGPFTAEGERALFREHGVGVLVTKDAGGPMTDAKLTVAHEEGCLVVVLRRPHLPPAEEVHSVEEALAWVAHLPTPS
ncbi:cobalt-precorrin-6A reductase [Tessaracoccus lubricantis]